MAGFVEHGDVGALVPGVSRDAGAAVNVAAGSAGWGLGLAIRTETTNSFEEINPPALGAPRGFNHGLLVRPGWGMLFVAGQTAASTAGVVRDVAFVSQFTEALQKTIAVVQAAGGQPEHIVRMTVYVTDMDAYRESRASLTGVWQRLMGRHYPAMALVEVSRLVDPDATVEIEATAALPPRTL